MFQPVFAPSFSFDSQLSSTTANTDGGTFLSAKLTLDMSFNRHPAEGRFASDVDPLDQSGSAFVQPKPTFESVHEETYGLDTVLDQWKFPLRTDFARGIIWGPFRHCRGNSYADLASPEAALEDLHSYADHAMHPARPQPIVRRQRIFPILRTPPPVQTVVNSLASSVSSSSSSSSSSSHFSHSNKSSATSATSCSSSASSSSSSSSLSSLSSSSNNKRRRKLSSTTTFSTRPSRAAAIKASQSLQTSRQPKKAKFITLAITLTPVRRIRLCTTSQLKYIDL